jgi:CDP-diacylglycerol--serine O-phosphatidyltransferase
MNPESDSKDQANDQAINVDQILPVDEHEEEVQEGNKRVRRRGVYLLPNLFTTGALFAGFYAIIAATQGFFESASIALFVAMFLDGLDGRVARLTNTSSEFGVQYDSMSDLVSFGVAPALLMYNWSLVYLDKFGYAVAFVFVACAALRLARFNAQVNLVDKRYFIGLASPTAAAVLAAMVWVGHDMPLSTGFAAVTAGVTLGVALLMVSNVKYQSLKSIDMKGRVPFVFILALVMIFTIVAINPPKVLLTMAAIYVASGPVWLLIELLKKFTKSKQEIIQTEELEQNSKKHLQ